MNTTSTSPILTYLSGAVNADLVGPGIGFMLTPAMGNRPDLTGIPWAADNACFSQGASFRLDRFLSWLDSMEQYRDTCLFAVAPDVVGDAWATWERSEPVLQIIRDKGWPAALVAQNGLEEMLSFWGLEQVNAFWNSFDCLFIGGTTAFKLSEETRRLCSEAKRREKYLHMGRCNSGRRCATAIEFGCDSVDGTFAAFRFREFSGEEVRRQIIGWIEQAEAQPSLF